MNKMTKCEQQKLAVDFVAINYLSQTMLVQDIMNIKALDEYKEPPSYTYLYKIDALTQELAENVQLYIKTLKDEQKIIVELKNLIKS